MSYCFVLKWFCLTGSWGLDFEHHNSNWQTHLIIYEIENLIAYNAVNKNSAETENSKISFPLDKNIFIEKAFFNKVFKNIFSRQKKRDSNTEKCNFMGTVWKKDLVTPKYKYCSCVDGICKKCAIQATMNFQTIKKIEDQLRMWIIFL